MTNHRHQQKKSYRNDEEIGQAAGFYQEIRGRRRIEEPDSWSHQPREGRRSPGVEGPFWNPEQGQGGRPNDQFWQIDNSRNDGGQEFRYYNNIPPGHEQMPLYRPHPDYDDHQEEYEDPVIYYEDLDHPLFDFYTGEVQKPQMGLILSTVAIITVVLGLAFFWVTGGEGFSAMAARSSAAGFENGAQPLVDPSTGQSPLTAGTGDLAPFFAPSVLYWENEIISWAARHNLDPNMVATVMQIESCGDPQAVSRAGATGLFQVMPFHFMEGEDPFDPDTNALRGMNYLAERLVQTGGNVGKAFAGYNGGHVAAAGDWDSWVAETQRYYTWATGIYDEALRGLVSSETLNRWYEAGGRSLCAQAETRLQLN